MSKIPVVISVATVEPHVLLVSFDDGLQRQVDIADLLHGEMFEPLKDPDVFRQAYVDTELGTVVWPTGADLSPEFLHHRNPERV